MHEDRRAISRYVFFIGSGAVSWYSKSQEVIALSTTEAEYMATTHATKEAIWLRVFFAQVFQPLTKRLEEINLVLHLGGFNVLVIVPPHLKQAN